MKRRTLLHSSFASLVILYRGGFVLDTASGMFYRLTPAADYLLRS